MELQVRDERQLKALTGLSQPQFDHLVPVFSAIYTEKQQQAYEDGVAAGTRDRKPGGGAKGKLRSLADWRKGFRSALSASSVLLLVRRDDVAAYVPIRIR